MCSRLEYASSRFHGSGRQGNGTAAISGGEATVYTISIHQENNYPYPKPPSDLDVNLHNGVQDTEYLTVLEDSLDKALAEFNPQVVFYLAGADPYREDQLGGLKATTPPPNHHPPATRSGTTPKR